ncbi:hypothetical protein KCU32_001863 [Vibrio parahaemolyticus]|nr:hypothetical protein [Vibrio parahaemolyticus]
MKTNYKIPKNDPDLEVFERFIADFHPRYQRLQNTGFNKPSYEHDDFAQIALEHGPFPGSNDDYCLFSLTLFNKHHLANYLLECQLFLEKPYGRKKEASIDRLKADFAEAVGADGSELIMVLNLLTNKACAIWIPIILGYLDSGSSDITPDVLETIIKQCEQVSSGLKLLSQSPELNHKTLGTLDKDGRYGLLAKLLLQGYQEYIPTFIQQFAETKGIDIDVQFPVIVDVVLAHQLTLQLKHRPEAPRTPNEFIYKEISSSKKTKAQDLRAHYRWLMIKAWLYSYLKKHNMTLSEAAKMIAGEDRFFYLSSQAKLEDYRGSEHHRVEIIDDRFNDLKNNLSAWQNSNTGQGYIYTKIREGSKDQA